MTQLSAPRAVLAVLLTGTMAAAIVTGLYESSRHKSAQTKAAAIPAAIAPSAGEEGIVPAPRIVADIPPNATGEYLASHFAQSQNDWRKASAYLDGVLRRDADNMELMRRSMILALGAGDFPAATDRAKQILATDKDQDTLAYLITAASEISEGQYDVAQEILAAMPPGDMADFVVPLMREWAAAGKGDFNPASLSGSTIHAYHGGLIAKFLNRDDKDVAQFAHIIIQPEGLTAEEYERAADLFVAANDSKDALKIYHALADKNAGSAQMKDKIDAIESGKPADSFLAAHRIKTPAQGAGLAVFDLARILFQEDSDSSARIFANLALGLDPDLVEARLLLATSSAHSKQYDDALQQFDRIPESHHLWRHAQYAAADMLGDAGRLDDAVRRLQSMFSLHRDIEAKIRTGDLYREREQFENALTQYNEAVDALGGTVPAEYWYLLFSRGMCYEQLKNWPAAEKDLQAALEFEPNQPFLLNYLGYGWADQGVKLEQSLTLIEQALSLQPNDGYITDSLGWVYYKIGQYDEAVNNLERAVELLPYDPTINDHLGDAYWAVGRKMEARFQWERARNYAGDTDADLVATLSDKLENGMPAPQPIKAASTAPVEKTR